MNVKRTLSILLALCMLLCVLPAPAYAAPSGGAKKSLLYWGDANLDGMTNMADVVLINQSMIDSGSYGVNGSSEGHITAEGASCADVYRYNGGELTGSDAGMVQSVIVGTREPSDLPADPVAEAPAYGYNFSSPGGLPVSGNADCSFSFLNADDGKDNITVTYGREASLELEVIAGEGCPAIAALDAEFFLAGGLMLTAIGNESEAFDGSRVVSNLDVPRAAVLTLDEASPMAPADDLPVFTLEVIVPEELEPGEYTVGFDKFRLYKDSAGELWSYSVKPFKITVKPPEYWGDVNGDGVLDLSDAVLLYQYLDDAPGVSLSVQDRKRADVSGYNGGSPEPTDGVLIEKVVVGNCPPERLPDSSLVDDVPDFKTPVLSDAASRLAENADAAIALLDADGKNSISVPYGQGAALDIKVTLDAGTNKVAAFDAKFKLTSGLDLSEIGSTTEAFGSKKIVRSDVDKLTAGVVALNGYSCSVPDKDKAAFTLNVTLPENAAPGEYKVDIDSCRLFKDGRGALYSVSVAPFTVTVESAKPNIKGSGTAEDPYLIGTAAELAEFRDVVNGTHATAPKNRSACAVLTADIDLGGINAQGQGVDENKWTPIGGDGAPYRGVFDGRGFSVSGLFVSGSFKYAGLFGYLNGSTVKNLSVGGIVATDHSEGLSYAGGVAGYSDGSLISCRSCCDVTINGGSQASAGGVAGYCEGVIERCSAAGTVRANGIMSNAGGVVGQNIGTVKNCYSTGDVTVGESALAGGVVGKNYASVINCFSTGTVTVGTGGFCDGIVAIDLGDTISGCYSLSDASVGGNLTADEFKNTENFYVPGDPAKNWAFEGADAVWYMGENSPELIRDVGAWGSLSSALNAGGSIRLAADVTCGANEGALTVPAGVTAVLDLNGHTVDRALTKAKSYGEVISVKGALTVNDSSATKADGTDGKGKITGGYKKDPAALHGGGGVFVDTKASFTLNGGAICGNTAAPDYFEKSYGGGVCVALNGAFTMNGGVISMNRALGDNGAGGGVYAEGSSFTMNGGVIEKNLAGGSGGGVYSTGHVTAAGGSITQNVAPAGGGICLTGVNAGPLFLEGRVVISGNLCDGTVEADGTLTGETESNLYLGTGDSNKIYVTGKLDESTLIGVTMVNPDVFTFGLSGKGTAANFTSDNGGYVVSLTDGGEAMLEPVIFTVAVTAGANMTKTAASGDASQQVTGGKSMTAVVYTANEEYYFPTDYAVAAVNGVSVTRDSFTQITVSGAPTADAAITLTAPTAKHKITFRAGSDTWAFEVNVTRVCHEYTIESGSLLGSDAVTGVVFSGSISGSGSVPNEITSVTIMNAGVDVTPSYDVTFLPGTLTVNPPPEVTVSNAVQTVYVNDPIEDMEITAVNAIITSVTGLPAGVSWSGTTISGTPTETGLFDITVTVTSDQTPSCGTATADVGITVEEAPGYDVTVTAGANMTKTAASGATRQQVTSGESMTDVIYTANEGYYFPTDYAVDAVNGVSVTRNSFSQITVSGTPTANAAMTLTAATAKTKESTPEAVFTATGPDCGTLTNVTTAMKYSVDGGNTWLAIASVPADITGVTAENGIKVYLPTSDTNTKLGSDVQTIEVTKAEMPEAVFTATGADCGTLSNVTTAMKYSVDGGDTWLAITAAPTDITSVTAANGVRVYIPATGADAKLGSDVQTIAVTKAVVPDSVMGEACKSYENNDGALLNVTAAMEYRADFENEWKAGTGEDIKGLDPGTYLVRVKPSGAALTSDTKEIRIAPFDGEPTDEFISGSLIPPDEIAALIREGTPITVDGDNGEKVIIDVEALKELAGPGASVNVTVETNEDGTTVVQVIVGVTPVTVPVKINIPADEGTVLAVVNEDGSITPIAKSVVGDGEVCAIVQTGTAVKAVENEKTFPDVSRDAWYAEPVAFVTERGLFEGTGSGFGPTLSFTRAMLATVLYRLEGAKAEGLENVFADVPGGAWYEDAASWAGATGILEGTDKGFEPNLYVTREQAAVAFFRYAKYTGLDVSGRASLDAFFDGGTTSDWAVDAMEWAVDAGLFQGDTEGRLDPRGATSRAQAAALFERLIKLILK